MEKKSFNEIISRQIIFCTVRDKILHILPYQKYENKIWGSVYVTSK